MEEIYRDCASIAVFRPATVEGGTVYHVLLLHKPRKKDAWQLPQGGVEKGENFEDTALRELKEEAGIDATFIGKSDRIYQYDFPASYRRFRPDNVKGQRIQYAFAAVPENIQILVDNGEIDAYAWVLPEQLDLYIKRPEYLELVGELVREGLRLVQ